MVGIQLSASQTWVSALLEGRQYAEDTRVIIAVLSVNKENGASRGNSRRISPSPSAGFSEEVRDWALRPNPLVQILAVPATV